MNIWKVLSMKKRLTKEEKLERKQREHQQLLDEKNLSVKREIIYKRMVAAQKKSLEEPKAAPAGSFISLQHINKIYPNRVQAVFDFNLEIKEREFIVFVGPSGCGKSTTLRMIAGLESITGGDLYIDNVFANELEPKDRDVAMVFQSYALYPHMSVFDNMAFGLQMRHVPKEEIEERVHKAAQILEIEDYLDRKPKALSGGQRQRVALGRAIVRNAKVFLMDEPLSNLDAKLRVQMRSEIVKLHNALGSTTIYVTHDQTEAMTMASRIVVMKVGYIQQIGKPKEIYDHPANTFVATFIGSPAMNIIEAKYTKEKIIINDDLSIPVSQKLAEAHDEFYKKQIELAEAKIKEIQDILEEAASEKVDKKDASAKSELDAENDNEIIKLNDNIKYFQDCLQANEHQILFGIRPEDVIEEESAILVKNQSHKIELKLTIAELLGNEYYAHLMLNGHDLIAKVNADKTLENGELVKVLFNLDKFKLFDPVTTNNIESK